MARVLLFIVMFALALYAVLDCARTPKDEMPANLPKPIVLIGIIMFAYVGPLAWIVVSRVMKAESKGSSIGTGLWSSDNPNPLFSRKKNQPETFRAPDNDPEFLWKLEKEIQRQRRAEREQGEGAQHDEGMGHQQGEGAQQQDDTTHDKSDKTDQDQ